MFAEPEAAGRSERRMSERPPRHDAEGVRPASVGEGTLRLRWDKFIDTIKHVNGGKFHDSNQAAMRHNPMLIGSCPQDRHKLKSAEAVAMCRAKGRHRLRLLTNGQSVPCDTTSFMMPGILERGKRAGIFHLCRAGIRLLLSININGITR